MHTLSLRNLRSYSSAQCRRSPDGMVLGLLKAISDATRCLRPFISTCPAKEVSESQESETEVHAKAWIYLLISHDAVAHNSTLAALRMRYEIKLDQPS